MQRAALILCLAAQSGLVGAQSASESPPPSAPQPVVTEIVISGERAKVETRVDRRVYAVSHDLQATLGSVADVLQNVPSVSIDIDGNPSLRGDSGVTIFIDGRFAPEFNRADRGAALQALAADGIDRIEVITNPPANFKREGTAGVINIITRRKLGWRSASARASVGSGGRYNIGTSQGTRIGELNLHGSATVKRELRIRGITENRILLDAGSGAALSEREFRGSGEDDRVLKSVAFGVDYEVNASDRVSAEASFRRRDSDSFFRDSAVVLDPAGTSISEYHRTRRSDEPEHESDITLAWVHKGERDGDGVKVSYQWSEESERRPLRFVEEFSLPPQPDLFQRQSFFEHGFENELSVESERSFDSKAKWILGYNLERQKSEFVAEQTIRAAAGPFENDPNFTNTFESTETIHALYASYEQPLGKWTTLVGLRLENVDLDLNQVTSNQRSSQSYFDVYPSVHVSRELNEQQMLTFSYSQRVFRPNWQVLNPYPVRVDEFSLREGSPDLRPAKVDKVEAGWNFERGQTSLSATVYARRLTDNVEFVTTPVSATSVVTRPENVGENVSGGLELIASGRLSPGIDFSLTANAYYSQLDASNLGFSARRSATNFDGKAALNWKPNEKSIVQMNLSSVGKQLSPQGYRQGSTFLDVGYRYQIRPNFALACSVSDVFDSRRNRTVLNSTQVSSSNSLEQPGRIAILGFSWTLAGKGNKAEKIEYDQ